MLKPFRKHLLVLLALLLAVPGASFGESVARQWNDALLEAIRGDFARPTVHARNLFHTSAAMYDAWAAYDSTANTYLNHETASAQNITLAQETAISYAAYRLLSWRFADSPSANESLAAFDALMTQLGLDPNITTTSGNSPAALGNRIADVYINYGLNDGANEQGGYENLAYEPLNPALVPGVTGNSTIIDPNRWQPLSIDFFIDQSGNVIPGGTPPFLGPEWGQVKPFSLTPADLTIYQRDGYDYWVYHDPGPPPMLGGVGDDLYKEGFAQVVEFSSLLDPADGVMIDVGPASNGDNTLGTNDGDGHDVNPATGLPYPPNIVPAGDYYRVLAEFWADGPDSETPPGHWFTIANKVSDDPAVVKRIGGTGPVLSDLEWDIKLYMTMGGAMHDVAIAAWGAKGWYDYIRPVSAIRYMATKGQSSDPNGPSYHPEGIPLIPGVIEVITNDSIQPGQRHEHLAGFMNLNVGAIAVKSWRGPDYIDDEETDTAGVGWILAGDWWPYQRPSFVTPPFAGYVSGHSTYSRAAAELMTLFTGDAYFPGGVGEFVAPQNEFLVFEDGPSVDVTLQWATYRDASDETSLSRIYGGIHPTADDIPGRLMGAIIGPEAFDYAMGHFNGEIGGPGSGTGGNCIPSSTSMCLQDGRFRIQVTWSDFTGGNGVGSVVPLGAAASDDSGLFWFFNAANWEMLIKVIDGCSFNSRYWVFAAATTDVAYTVTVTDTETNDTATYNNTLGVSSPAITDTEAFATCP